MKRFLTLFLLLSACSNAPTSEPPTIIMTDSVAADVGPDAEPDPMCGNQIIEDGEFCDDGPDNGVAGKCNDECTEIETCGDGVVDADETCDGGTELLCDDLGFRQGGAVGCSATCQIDLATCPGPRALPPTIYSVIWVNQDETMALVSIDDGQFGSLDLITLDVTVHGESIRTDRDIWFFDNWFVRVEDGDQLVQVTLGVPGETSLGTTNDAISRLDDGRMLVPLAQGDGFQTYLLELDGSLTRLHEKIHSGHSLLAADEKTAILGTWPTIDWVNLETDELIEFEGSNVEINRGRTHILFQNVQEILVDLSDGGMRLLGNQNRNSGFSSNGSFAWVERDAGCPEYFTKIELIDVVSDERFETDCLRVAGNADYHVRFTETDRYVLITQDVYQAPDWIEEIVYFDTITWTRGVVQTKYASLTKQFFDNKLLHLDFRADDDTRLILTDFETGASVDVDESRSETDFFRREDGWIRRFEVSNTVYSADFISVEDGSVRSLTTSANGLYVTDDRRHLMTMAETAFYLTSVETGDTKLIAADPARSWTHVSGRFLYYNPDDSSLRHNVEMVRLK